MSRENLVVGRSESSCSDHQEWSILLISHPEISSINFFFLARRRRRSHSQLSAGERVRPSSQLTVLSSM